MLHQNTVKLKVYLWNLVFYDILFFKTFLFLLGFEETIKTIMLFMIPEEILAQCLMGDECIYWLCLGGLFLHGQVHHWMVLVNVEKMK